MPRFTTLDASLAYRKAHPGVRVHVPKCEQPLPSEKPQRKRKPNRPKPPTPKQNRRARKKLTYRQYLQTDHWQAKRKEALQHFHSRCAVCAATEQLEVHHKNYSNPFAERMMDLEVLCRGCHENTHEGTKAGVYDPMTRAFFAALGQP